MSSDRTKHFARLFLALGFMASVFTQVYAITKIPGLHFDEAWQGEFANRFLHPELSHIGPEAPLAAMNSYTTPILHAILALQFKVWGPSLLVMRATLAALNLSALAICIAALAPLSIGAAGFFAFIWALLPLSVHDHRFYIEMTSLHGLCFALILAFTFGLKKNPKPSFAKRALWALAFWVGCYSHVLFIAVGISALIFVSSRQPEAWVSKTFRNHVAFFSLTLLPLATRMALGTKKAMPIVLVMSLASLALIAWRASEKQWSLIGKISASTARLVPFLAIPHLVFFSFYLMGGSWPYAQVTSVFSFWLGVPNAILWVLILATATSKPRTETEADAVAGFYCLFLTTSVLMLNQAPRYYVIALIAAIVVMALRLESLRPKIAMPIFLAFIGWNSFLFVFHYVKPFSENGARITEFRSWRFHDSARDFRPAQRVHEWLKTNGCRYSSDIEPTTFQIYLPLAFLSLTEPDDTLTCKLDKKNLMIATVPENLTSPVKGYRLLHTDRSWGDLAAWSRSP